jgi:2-pyrone-4,6-dicarboxylate lactonase
MITQRFNAPKGATNSHAHVIGPRDRFPFDPESPFPHPVAPADELFAMQDRLGLERLVLIQSLAHTAPSPPPSHSVRRRRAA